MQRLATPRVYINAPGLGKVHLFELLLFIEISMSIIIIRLSSF